MKPLALASSLMLGTILANVSVGMVFAERPAPSLEAMQRANSPAALTVPASSEENKNVVVNLSIQLESLNSAKQMMAEWPRKIESLAKSAGISKIETISKSFTFSPITQMLDSAPRTTYSVYAQVFYSTPDPESAKKFVDILVKQQYDAVLASDFGGECSH
jgi:hypothetical protein